MHEVCKILSFCHFYAEVVKFGLILTHLKLFGGQTGGGKKHIFWGQMPPCPLWCCRHRSCCLQKIHVQCPLTKIKQLLSNKGNAIRPFPYTSAPARLHLPVPHVSTKPLESSLSLHAKIFFYIWNERIKHCNMYYYEVNWSVLHVNC